MLRVQALDPAGDGGEVIAASQTSKGEPDRFESVGVARRLRWHDATVDLGADHPMGRLASSKDLGRADRPIYLSHIGTYARVDPPRPSALSDGFRAVMQWAP